MISEDDLLMIEREYRQAMDTLNQCRRVIQAQAKKMETYGAKLKRENESPRCVDLKEHMSSAELYVLGFVDA